MSGFSSGVYTSPAGMLLELKELFHKWGIFGQTFSIEHEGNRYRISCKEEAFLVYRVNHGVGPRHHVPGWPVCLVTESTVYEEHSLPELGDDHCASGADLGKWLDIIKRHRAANPVG